MEISFLEEMTNLILTDVHKDVYDVLFDEDGNCNICVRIADVIDLITKNNWGPFSDAVKYVYSDNIDCMTHGNYSSICFWR